MAMIFRSKGHPRNEEGNLVGPKGQAVDVLLQKAA